MIAVKSRRLRPIHPDVAPVPGHQRRRAPGAAWALSFLTTLSSVVFAMAAIAGWILNLWPANPLTLIVAAFVVLSGPTLTLALRGAVVERRLAPAPRRVAAPVAAPVAPRRPAPAALPPLTPEQAYGRALLDWRDRPWR
jgi:hypothetical protein